MVKRDALRHSTGDAVEGLTSEELPSNVAHDKRSRKVLSTRHAARALVVTHPAHSICHGPDNTWIARKLDAFQFQKEDSRSSLLCRNTEDGDEALDFFWDIPHALLLCNRRPKHKAVFERRKTNISAAGTGTGTGDWSCFWRVVGLT
ncbi:hypothetical protein PAXINDRAFT_99386 [Paxillus involutus ATCC 200175]|uniref:Uncharacterized protein n=1 Tax=Paxillus involutus ATCC 200175 TaxID=664439 RepID=A0A0C9SZD9_PAXIN|nr:hypothetical protein PAXINDRAFT_99386 [Paxillus involutus ATCC 200175]